MSSENQKTQTAIFAMGCFWCGESEFRAQDTHLPLPGIMSVVPGYAGGTIPNPTYENHVGYKEAIKIVYDPVVISYDQLLDIFWKNIDPFDSKGQFCDKGYAYTAVIFYGNEDQKTKATATKNGVQKQLGRDVKTEIVAATTFYDAEDYHQNYKAKNPVRYNYYRWRCGRDSRLEQVWNQK